MTYTYVATHTLGWFVDQVQEEGTRWSLHYYDWDDRQAKVVYFDQVTFERGYFWTKGQGVEPIRWGQGYVGLIEREVPAEEDGYRVVAYNRRAHR